MLQNSTAATAAQGYLPGQAQQQVRPQTHRRIGVAAIMRQPRLAFAASQGDRAVHGLLSGLCGLLRSTNILKASHFPFQEGLFSNYLCILKPYAPGDANLDGRIDNFDIDAFVWALTDPGEYEERYSIPPEVGRILGDVNVDGALNNFDIDPFVELLIAQP
ncbi:MAG: hypothetical protein AB7Q17_04530 [Phycisphaerae bacterium]